MQKHFRKSVWLAVASLVILSLTIGSILAHEGRPVGDYRFIVGWIEEPAYEGSKNSVSVQINKVVDSEEAEDDGHDHEDGDGHGDEEETSHSHDEGEEGDGHHGGEDEDSSSHGHDENGDGHHDGEDEDSSSHGHDEDGDEHHDHEDGDGESSMSHEGDHHDDEVESEGPMSVAFRTFPDSISGINLQIISQGFEFTPENVNQGHVDGEGHAHVYVDGVKIGRVYTPWIYLGKLEPGMREIRVTLNANGHPQYTYGGEKVEAVSQVTVPEPSEQMHGHALIEAESPMSVSLTLEPDTATGANLYVETGGFTFAPRNSGGEHVEGEGHAHVYVNGVKIGRLYGEAMNLGKLAEGMNEVRVSLNSNNHAGYTWNGEPVEATATINIEPGMGGEGYGSHSSGGHDDSDHQHNGSGTEDKEGHSSITVGGASKPLASVVGQTQGVAPVEGLEGSIQVEVSHAASGASRTFDLYAVFGEPGHYAADLIPTAAGVYEFRIFGTIEGTEIDETFVSQGAGGDFDDVLTSVELQFPEQLPELREVVGAVQGARDIAQEAQDAALAAQQSGDGGALAVVALIVGIAGAALGAAGIFVGLRRRQT